MKKSIAGLIATFAIMVAASLATAGSASAVTLPPTRTNGGVTCTPYQVGGGTVYPNYYWNCVHPTSPTSQEANGPATVETLTNAHSNVATTVGNVQLYLFNNAADYANFFGTTAPDAKAFGANGTFSGTTVAAAFASATINGASTPLTADYGADLVQQIGQLFYVDSGTTYSASNSTFTAAYQYDQNVSGACSSANWPSGWCSAGMTNWQVFRTYYLSDEKTMFGDEFAVVAGDNTANPPNSALYNYFLNTKGIIQNYVLGSTVNAATANGGILCVAIHTTATFPSTYYDCARPYNGDASDQAAVNAAANLGNSAFETDLKNRGVSLYIMNSMADYNKYFGTNNSTQDQGFSIGTTSAVFRMLGTVSLLSYMPAATAHEMAHQLDSYWGDVSSKSTFGTAYSSDNTALSALTCAQVWGTQIDPLSGTNEEVCQEYTGSATDIMNNDFGGWNTYEAFADAFQNKTQYRADSDHQLFENHFNQLNKYMTNVFSSGTAN